MTKTEIANRALRRAGIGQTLTDLATDDSENADACRDHYDDCRDEALEYGPWSFATRRAVLALVAGTAPEEWEYQYGLPTDCVRPLDLPSGLRAPRADQETEFIVESDGSQRLLYTDQEDATLRYVARNDDPSTYSRAFADALVYRLAADLALALARNPQLAGQLLDLYDERINRAFAIDQDAQRRQGPSVMSSLEASR